MEKNNIEFLEKLVHINRITKVVKGGRRFGFSALVVVGNQNGKIGIAHAKAKQVPDAIKKAKKFADYEEEYERIGNSINRPQAIEILKLVDKFGR